MVLCSLIESYYAQLISVTDYTAFGVALEGRTWSNPAQPIFEMYRPLEEGESISVTVNGTAHHTYTTNPRMHYLNKENLRSAINNVSMSKAEYLIRIPLIFLIMVTSTYLKSQKIILDYSVLTKTEISTKHDSIRMNLVDSLFVYSNYSLKIEELEPQSKLKYLHCSFPNANKVVNVLSLSTNIEEMSIVCYNLIDTLPFFFSNMKLLKRIDIPISCTNLNFDIISNLISLTDLTIDEKGTKIQETLPRLKELKSLKKLKIFLDHQSLRFFYNESKELHLEELEIYSKKRVDMNKINIRSLISLKIDNKYHIDLDKTLPFRDSLKQFEINRFEKNTGLEIIYLLPSLENIKISLANVDLEKLDCSRVEKKLKIILGYGNYYKYHNKIICGSKSMLRIESNPMLRM